MHSCVTQSSSRLLTKFRTEFKASPRVWRITSRTELLLRGYNFTVANKRIYYVIFLYTYYLFFFKNLQKLLDELWKQNAVAPIFVCLNANSFRFSFWKHFLIADNTNIFLKFFLEFTKFFRLLISIFVKFKLM